MNYKKTLIPPFLCFALLIAPVYCDHVDENKSWYCKTLTMFSSPSEEEAIVDYLRFQLNNDNQAVVVVASGTVSTASVAPKVDFRF